MFWKPTHPTPPPSRYRHRTFSVSNNRKVYDLPRITTCQHHLLVRYPHQHRHDYQPIPTTPIIASTTVQLHFLRPITSTTHHIAPITFYHRRLVWLGAPGGYRKAKERVGTDKGLRCRCPTDQTRTRKKEIVNRVRD